jgi:hypothetical protein
VVDGDNRTLNDIGLSRSEIGSAVFGGWRCHPTYVAAWRSQNVWKIVRTSGATALGLADRCDIEPPLTQCMTMRNMRIRGDLATHRCNSPRRS